MSTLLPSQWPALNTAIKADAQLNALPNDTDGCQTIANAFNLVNSPDWWVWKTSLTLAEATQDTSVDGTTFSWTQFISRTVQEQNGWLAMWGAQGRVNPSLPNVRQGFLDIFSGNQAAPIAQRTHLAAVGRRKARRAEKLYTTGAGTATNPALLDYEGFIDWQDVNAARNLG